MLFACILTNILAIALPSLRISPLLLIRIATIVLLYAVAISIFVIYIQSIGSGIGIFSGLFHATFPLWGQPDQIAGIYDSAHLIFHGP